MWWERLTSSAKTCPRGETQIFYVTHNVFLLLFLLVHVIHFIYIINMASPPLSLCPCTDDQTLRHAHHASRYQSDTQVMQFDLLYDGAVPFVSMAVLGGLVLSRKARPCLNNTDMAWHVFGFGVFGVAVSRLTTLVRRRYKRLRSTTTTK